MAHYNTESPVQYKPTKRPPQAASQVGHKIYERGELGRIQRQTAVKFDEWLERRGFKKPTRKFIFIKGVRD